MHWRIKSMLSCILRALAPAKPVLEWLVEAECFVASAWAKSAHKQLMMVSWRIPPQPKNFDHQIDQFYLWAVSRNPQ